MGQRHVEQSWVRRDEEVASACDLVGVHDTTGAEEVPDCRLTNRELQQMANTAKERAKGTKEEKENGTGKNHIAAYEGNGFSPADMHIVRPIAG